MKKQTEQKKTKQGLLIDGLEKLLVKEALANHAQRESNPLNDWFQMVVPSAKSIAESFSYKLGDIK